LPEAFRVDHRKFIKTFIDDFDFWQHIVILQQILRILSEVEIERPPRRRPYTYKLVPVLCQFSRAFGIYTDELASLAFVLKFNKALDQGEQRVVLAAADVVARFPLRAALARKDISPEHVLAAKFLKSEPLRM